MESEDIMQQLKLKCHRQRGNHCTFKLGFNVLEMNIHYLKQGHCIFIFGHHLVVTI